jgi:pimeloyl-ACP methyl ester carboxylesterase
LVSDAAGVLDAYGVGPAHLVGASAGGALAQLFALDLPDRVLSLVLISTSPAAPVDRELPGPNQAFGRFVSTAQVDWSDAGSLTDYLVDYSRVISGGQRAFDEQAARDLVRRDVARARDFAALQNHESIPDSERQRDPLSSISAPTLVVHGSADPIFPIAHGKALAEAIPGARLLCLEGAGHGVYRADWEAIAPAIVEHTAAVERSRASGCDQFPGPRRSMM